VLLAAAQNKNYLKIYQRKKEAAKDWQVNTQ
jgi:hypothetical protein